MCDLSGDEGADKVSTDRAIFSFVQGRRLTYLHNERNTTNAKTNVLAFPAKAEMPESELVAA